MGIPLGVLIGLFVAMIIIFIAGASLPSDRECGEYVDHPLKDIPARCAREFIDNNIVNTDLFNREVMK